MKKTLSVLISGGNYRRWGYARIQLPRRLFTWSFTGLSRRRRKSSKDFNTDLGSTGMGTFSFQIRTLTDGFNSRRTYYLHSNSAGQCREFVVILRKLVESARTRAENNSKLSESQKWLRSVYDSNSFQIFSSFLIVLAIARCWYLVIWMTLMAVLFAELCAQHHWSSNPRTEGSELVLNDFDMFLVCAFTAELCINPFANWFWDFVSSLGSMWSESSCP